MTTVKIKGMRCQHCVGSTSQALEKIQGISDIKVDLEKGEASYQGDVDIKIVKEAILKIGFEVEQ
jgi:copper chaperone